MNQEIQSRIKFYDIHDALKDDMVILKDLDSTYVSDGIGDEYQYWCHRNPIFISSQTGSGKNTFIENKIIPYCIENDLKILIITNRITACRQEKYRIIKITNCPDILKKHKPYGLDDIEYFKNVRIMTYQKLEKYINSFNEANILKNYDIVVFDECHFFTNDFLFNNFTYKILNEGIILFKNCIRIFMTSTPDQVFPLILNEEKKFDDNLIFSQYYYNPKEFLYYRFKRNYEYINIKYFHKKEEILHLINNDNSNMKWMIFLNNKNAGQKLIEKLHSPHTIFISAESKNSNSTDGKFYNEIINKESFNCKILITTSVMDNSVNFKDNLLKNIVIFTYSKTEFLQVLGRKRISNGEKINLYLYSGNAIEINRNLHIIKKQIDAINEFEINSINFLNKYFFNSEIYKGLLYFDQYLKPIINPISRSELLDINLFYEKLLIQFNSGNKDIFILQQLDWLGLKASYNPNLDISHINSDNTKNKFEIFLNSYCNRTLSGEELDYFEKQFKILANNCYGKQLGDRPDRPNYKATKMRAIFFKYHLNYEIEIKDKVFTLHKKIQ
ncbi:MAG: DEAD/DEAH box helicase family protein [Clostridium sp.]|jgi:superfamily II DNA or RNA helicase|uniref:DEAD/DEAH box helicase family protein n=1 Tax=Clostridium sp. TaxID=1506 RepID=UPI0025C24FCF|nr:DEAD/DEAH box helicase family protein [Clostridium sp.]MCH3965516.1 DEAD/DEAH box helicase family protein [Clostridium sp.]MCI1716845.1 DEAD/DEAH box helicase family protein [Clostridium sp.]MCI1801225.1 DEAD/DEAH box helicase family protein [Clostridium sp.]MCI1815031.1 DEAD/DEAH box helicase family protein [Clostridium sp.]MCI1871932.1 DEAD/DEAH box helicase family protein [Clostridium sp.]